MSTCYSRRASKGSNNEPRLRVYVLRASKGSSLVACLRATHVTTSLGCVSSATHVELAKGVTTSLGCVSTCYSRSVSTCYSRRASKGSNNEPRLRVYVLLT